MAIFEFLGTLSVDFGIETFKRTLQPIFMEFLTNTAAKVRLMAITQVKKISRSFGAAWATETLIPKAVESFNVEQQSYNFRMCALESLSAVIPVLAPDQVNELILPTLEKAFADKVPNVRFCAARII